MTLKFDKNGKAILSEGHKTYGSALRGLITGASRFADAPYIPADIYNFIKGEKATRKRPSEKVKELIDVPTKGELIPTTKLGKIADTVAQYGAEGLTGAGILKGAANAHKAVPYLTEGARKVSRFLKPTTSGAVGMGTMQSVLNENENNLGAAFFANLLATGGAKKVNNVVKAANDYKNKFIIRTNKTHQKSLEKELGKNAGSESIEKVPANMAGLNIEGSNEAYRKAKQAEFNNTYRNLEHELKQKVGKDAQSRIHISVKKPAQTLRKEYFRLQDDVQKNALLATPAGKMWLRSLNIKPGTNSFDLDNLLFKGSKKLKDPKLNLAEAKQFNDSLRDSITTFGGEIGNNEQRLLRTASSQLTTDISNAYHKIDPDLAKKYQQTNKAFSRWQKEDVPFLNKTKELSGEPEKIFGEALRDLDKGAKPLDTALRMSSGTKKSNISKGVINELGNVDNKFDLPAFYDKFRGHSVKEQNRILKGLAPEERIAFDQGLNKYKSYLDIKSNPNYVERLFGAKKANPDKLMPSTSDLASDLILGASKEPSARKLNVYKDLLDKNLASKEKKSLLNKVGKLTEARELGRAAIEVPASHEREIEPGIQDYVSSMSDEELMADEAENAISQEAPDIMNYVSSMSDEELMRD